jgi:hypothetical protein
MTTMTFTSQVLRELRQGPSTSAELAAILLPKEPHRHAMRRCSAMLCYLRSIGRTKVIGHVPREGHRGTGIMSNLFALK